MKTTEHERALMHRVTCEHFEMHPGDRAPDLGLLDFAVRVAKRMIDVTPGQPDEGARYIQFTDEVGQEIHGDKWEKRTAPPMSYLASHIHIARRFLFEVSN